MLVKRKPIHSLLAPHRKAIAEEAIFLRQNHGKAVAKAKLVERKRHLKEVEATLRIFVKED